MVEKNMHCMKHESQLPIWWFLCQNDVDSATGTVWLRCLSALSLPVFGLIWIKLASVNCFSKFELFELPGQLRKLRRLCNKWNGVFSQVSDHSELQTIFKSFSDRYFHFENRSDTAESMVWWKVCKLHQTAWNCIKASWSLRLEIQLNRRLRKLKRSILESLGAAQIHKKEWSKRPNQPRLTWLTAKLHGFSTWAIIRPEKWQGMNYEWIRFRCSDDLSRFVMRNVKKCSTFNHSFFKKNVNFFKHIIWSWNFQLPTFNLPFGCFLFVVPLMISPNFAHLESGYQQASQNRLRMFDIEEMGPNMAMDQLVSSLKMEVCEWNLVF